MITLLERPGPRLPRTLRAHLGVAAAKSVALTIALTGSFLTCLVLADLHGTASNVPVRETVDPAIAKIAQYRCSTTGFPEGEVPASALVRRDGAIEQVTFGAGWAAHEGKAPGTLVAVCRVPMAG